MRRRRAWTPGIAAFAALVVAVATCEPTERAAVFESPARNSASGTDADTRQESPHVRRRVGTTPTNVLEADPAVAGDAPGTIDGFPATRVSVVHADGSAASGATVYAVRAGAPGPVTSGVGTSADTASDGTCRIVFVGSGRFDVGAAIGPLRALVADVEIPRAAPLRIVLPHRATVVVVGTDAASSRLRPGMPQLVNVATAAYGTARARQLPGRDDPLQWTYAVVFPQGKTEVGFPVPPDTDLRLFLADSFTGTPERFRAPAVIRLDHVEWLALKLHVALEPAVGREPAEGWVAPSFESDPEGVSVLRPGSCAYEGLATDAAGRRVLTYVMRVRTPAGRLRWSGPGLESGTIGFSGLLPGADNVVSTTIRLDGTPLPPADPRVRVAPPTRLRVVDPGGSEAPLAYFVAHDHGGGMGSQARPGEVVVARVLDPGWIVAYRDHAVAGPVPVIENPEAVHELTLRPGGMVVLAVEHPPPVGLGSFTIGPRDGGLILSVRSLLPRVAVRDGDRLGPLPVGRHEFVLRVGDEVLGEVSVAVGPGTTEVLRIPRLGPLR